MQTVSLIVAPIVWCCVILCWATVLVVAAAAAVTVAADLFGFRRK